MIRLPLFLGVIVAGVASTSCEPAYDYCYLPAKALELGGVAAAGTMRFTYVSDRRNDDVVFDDLYVVPSDGGVRVFGCATSHGDLLRAEIGFSGLTDGDVEKPVEPLVGGAPAPGAAACTPSVDVCADGSCPLDAAFLTSLNESATGVTHTFGAIDGNLSADVAVHHDAGTISGPMDLRAVIDITWPR